MRKNFFIVALAFLLMGCASTCQYKSDFGIMNNAQANDPSFPVIVQANNLNSICLDSQKIAGLCSFRISRASDLIFKFIERPYSYSLKMDCTDELNLPMEPIPVVANHALSVIIPKKNFEGVKKSFSCEGEMFPTDRGEASIRFRIHITLVDAAFQGLEKPTRIDNYVALGEHALYSVCGDSSGIKQIKKTPYFEDKDKKYKWCFVEAESGRTSFNGEL